MNKNVTLDSKFSLPIHSMTFFKVLIKGLNVLSRTMLLPTESKYVSRLPNYRIVDLNLQKEFSSPLVVKISSLTSHEQASPGVTSPS